MSDIPLPTAPNTTSPPASQAPAALPQGKSGYLTSTFGMTVAALLLLLVLALKDKLDANLAGLLLLALPAFYGYLRKERALGHAELNAGVLLGAANAATTAALAVRAPALVAALAGPDASSQARNAEVTQS